MEARPRRAKPVDLDRVWDDYEAHVEDNAFEKMRARSGGSSAARRASSSSTAPPAGARRSCRSATTGARVASPPPVCARCSSPRRRDRAGAHRRRRRRDGAARDVAGTERTPGRRRGEDTDRSPGSAREPPGRAARRAAHQPAAARRPGPVCLAHRVVSPRRVARPSLSEFVSRVSINNTPKDMRPTHSVPPRARALTARGDLAGEREERASTALIPAYPWDETGLRPSLASI